MKVLVVHPSLDTIALLDGLSQCNASAVTYCAGAADAIRELERTQDPSIWVIIEDDGRREDARDVAGAIRAAGFDVSICFLSHRLQASAQATRARPAICAVEHTGDGLQILRCALHRAGKDAEHRAAHEAAAQDRPFVFEYHAPCKRGG